MESAILRLNRQGLDVDGIAKKSQMPLSFIEKVLENASAL